jgi:hypothetical protein
LINNIIFLLAYHDSKQEQLLHFLWVFEYNKNKTKNKLGTTRKNKTNNKVIGYLKNKDNINLQPNQLRVYTSQILDDCKVFALLSQQQP